MRPRGRPAPPDGSVRGQGRTTARRASHSLARRAGNSLARRAGRSGATLQRLAPVPDLAGRAVAIAVRSVAPKRAGPFIVDAKNLHAALVQYSRKDTMRPRSASTGVGQRRAALPPAYDSRCVAAHDRNTTHSSGMRLHGTIGGPVFDSILNEAYAARAEGPRAPRFVPLRPARATDLRRSLRSHVPADPAGAGSRRPAASSHPPAYCHIWTTLAHEASIESDEAPLRGHPRVGGQRAFHLQSRCFMPGCAVL
jgi:hypothetical protein